MISQAIYARSCAAAAHTLLLLFSLVSIAHAQGGAYPGSPERFPRGTDRKVYDWVSSVIDEAKKGLDQNGGGGAGGRASRAREGSGRSAADEARRVGNMLPSELSETVDGQKAFRKADYQDGNDNWFQDYVEDSIRVIDDTRNRDQFMSCLTPRLVTDPALVQECQARCPPITLDLLNHPCVQGTDLDNRPRVYEIWLPQDVMLIGDWQDSNARYNATNHYFPELDRQVQEQLKQQTDELVKMLITAFQYTDGQQFEDKGLRKEPRYAQGHLQDKENMLWWASWRTRADWVAANNKPKGERFRCGWLPQAPRKEQCLFHVFPRPTNEKDIVHNVATNLTFSLVSSLTVMSNFIGDQEREWTRMASMPPGTPQMWGKDPLARTWMSGQHTCMAMRMREYENEGYPDLKTAMKGVPQERDEKEARVVCLRNGQDFFPASLTTDETPGGSPWYSDQLRTAMVGNYLTSSKSDRLSHMHRNDKGRGVLLTFNDRPESSESLYETLDRYQVTYPALDNDKPSKCVTSHQFPHMLDQGEDFYKENFPHDKDKYEDTDKNTMAVVAWNKIVTCTCRIISASETIPGCSFIPGEPERGSPRSNGDRLFGHREEGQNMDTVPDPVQVALPRLRQITRTEPIPGRGSSSRSAIPGALGAAGKAGAKLVESEPVGCRGCTMSGDENGSEAVR